MIRLVLAGCAALVMVLSTVEASASGVVIVTDTSVSQYREALQAAKAVLQDAVEVDVTRPGLEDLLGRAQPSVVLAIGRNALTLAMRALPATPIVHCVVLGAPTARNVTGVRLEPSASLHLERFAEIHPRARRIGVLHDGALSRELLDEARRLAPTMQITLVVKVVSSPAQLKPALDEIGPSVQALWLLPNPRLLNRDNVDTLMQYAIDQRKAVFGFLDGLTRQGALASISPDYRESGRLAALLVQRILARTDPSQPLPAVVASPGRATVNLTTAERIGLTVPARSLSAASQIFR